MRNSVFIQTAVMLCLFLLHRGYSQNCNQQPPDSDFLIEVLVDGTEPGDGMDLDIANDGRVFWTERTTRKLQVFYPQTNSKQVIHTFSENKVHSARTTFQGNGNEGGLQGLALDGDFDNNHFVYIHYTAETGPFNPGDFAVKERLSRFTLTNNDTELDLNSEIVLLEYTIIAQCCHHGGDVEWGPDGNLWLTTGDNTSLSYNSDGVPIHNTDVNRDARSGTANTNSYRGKILRIHPEMQEQPNGKWYTIPDGNLFQPGTANTLPEIYSMGHRNPYSIGIDVKKYGTTTSPWVLIGEAGPALGTDEVNLVKEAGFFGWPFLNRNNANMGMANYDPNNIVNNSPFNDGLTNLPPAQPAIAWYGAGGNSGHGLGGCIPGGGPFMTFDSTLDSDVKFPPWFDDKVLLFSGWGGAFWVGQLDQNGVLDNVNRIFNSNLGGSVLRMKRGPDGAVYSISNGGGFFVPGTSNKIYRISYRGNCNPEPVSIGEKEIFAQSKSVTAPYVQLDEYSRVILEENMGAVEIFNTMGKKVGEYHRTHKTGREKVRMAKLPKGVYQVRYLPLNMR